MNNQILNFLVESYKEKNVPMQTLLEDPIFRSLPIEKQIEAVQSYAGVLQQGRRPNMWDNSKTLARSIIKGSVSGLITGIPITFALKNKVIPKSVFLAVPTIAGGILGGTLGISDILRNNNKQNTINKYLSHMKEDKWGNAIKTLQMSRNASNTEEDIKKLTDQGLVGRLINGPTNMLGKITDSGKLPL